MKNILSIFILFFLLSACNENSSQNSNAAKTEVPIITNHDLKATTDQKNEITKRLSFKNVAEIVADSSYSTWVKIEDGSASLALHFQTKDTLAVSYSPECWLMYPYKLDGNKIIVFWDVIIDTKYDFEIVKAIEKTNKKYIGNPPLAQAFACAPKRHRACSSGML